jgi:hypothetical protein
MSNVFVSIRVTAIHGLSTTLPLIERHMTSVIDSVRHLSSWLDLLRVNQAFPRIFLMLAKCS